MFDNQGAIRYQRKMTALERFMHRSPFSIVTVVARIRGKVTESMLEKAVAQVQQRHRNLQVRVREDENHEPWFTSEGVQGIPIEVIPRESADQWIRVHQEASKVPFDFDVRPLIRFILLQSPEMSELIILCHHIICDGMSLAYLARDLMLHLGDPAREVEVLPDPVPVDLDNMPEGVSLNAIAKFFINRINKKWATERVHFDVQDYQDLNQAYWSNYEHQILPVELSETETSALVARCREEQVTVNSALTAAFVGAQCIVQGEKPYHSSIASAGSLRERLPRPAGEAMGYFASAVDLKFKYNTDVGFWENARRLHQKLGPLFTDRNLLGQPITWFHLDPTILEALNFKMLSGLVQPGSARYDKLSAFAGRDDVVSSILQREKLDSLDRIFLGTAVTNLTRLDFPREYGPLELDRLIMQPGGAFPLVNVNLVVGAVTCAGRLSLVLEYVEQAVDTVTMRSIRDQAMKMLVE